jgi:hypothetical protein
MNFDICCVRLMNLAILARFLAGQVSGPRARSAGCGKQATT